MNKLVVNSILFNVEEIIFFNIQCTIKEQAQSWKGVGYKCPTLQ
jgi:hypothetical protein